MPTPSTIALFSLAAVALAVVPGPAVAYIVTQSVDKGRRAGLVSALGVASGGIVHVAAAIVGLSALIASSATAFTAVKLVGAAYLIVVGIRRILGQDDEESTEAAPADLRRLYRQGAVVNVLNPKTALFFLAFLPQFVDPDRGSVTLQIAVLGLLFAAIALVLGRDLRPARGRARRTHPAHRHGRAHPPLPDRRHLHRARRHGCGRARAAAGRPFDADPTAVGFPGRRRRAGAGRHRAAPAVAARPHRGCRRGGARSARLSRSPASRSRSS